MKTEETLPNIYIFIYRSEEKRTRVKPKFTEGCVLSQRSRTFVACGTHHLNPDSNNTLLIIPMAMHPFSTKPHPLHLQFQDIITVLFN